MGKFIAGIIFGAVVLFFGAYVYIHYGYMNFQADQPVGKLERFVMRGAMDHYAERYAPKSNNPVQPTDENLIAGIKLYKENCAVCHGGPDKPISDVGRGLYPHAPQFVQDAPDMAPEQNFWITKHGVKQTGMPAWDKVFNDTQLWQITGFLSRMGELDKTSPAVQAAWKQGGQAELGAQQTPGQVNSAMPKKGEHQDTAPTDDEEEHHHHQH